MRVFVSHSSKDKKLTDLLVVLLRNALNLSSGDIRYTSAAGYGLKTGETILEALRRDVLKASAVIGLLTPNSLKSTWAIFELGARWGSGQRFFPLCAAGVTPHDLPEPIKSLSALECSDKSQLLKLLEDVARELDQDLEDASTFMEQIDELAALASPAVNSKSDNEGDRFEVAEGISTVAYPSDSTSEISSYLALDWADPDSRTDFPSPHVLTSIMLEPLLPEDTFEQALPGGPQSLVRYMDPFSRPNPDYSAELIAFAYSSAFVKPLGLSLRNNSSVTRRRVRFEGKLAKQDGFCILDDMVSFPSKIRNLNPNIDYRSIVQASPTWMELTDNEGFYEVVVEFGDIRPQEDVWTNNTLWFGSREPRQVSLEGKLLGDNIKEPFQCTLEIRFETECRPMTMDDVDFYKRAHFESLGVDEE